MISSVNGLVSTGTRLYYVKHGAVAFNEAANVKTVPEVGATPQTLEITNLVDSNQRYTFGLGTIPTLTFSIIYKGREWNHLYNKSGNMTNYDWKLTYPDGMYVTFSGPFQLQLEPIDINTAITYNLTVMPDDVPKFHKSVEASNDNNSELGSDDMSYRPMFVKAFDSVADMNAYDNSDEDVIQGDYVLINSEDDNRGKIYFYNGSGFTYFASILGPQGVQGNKGDTGLNVRMMGSIDTLPAIADEGTMYFVGTTLYSYTNGTWIDLGDFKGAQGIQGIQGIQGDSAYNVAVQNGFKGTEAEWLKTIATHEDLTNLSNKVNDTSTGLPSKADDSTVLHNNTLNFMNQDNSGIVIGNDQNFGLIKRDGYMAGLAVGSGNTFKFFKTTDATLSNTSAYTKLWELDSVGRVSINSGAFFTPADDSKVVHTTGNEEIPGNKNHTGSLQKSGVDVATVDDVSDAKTAVIGQSLGYDQSTGKVSQSATFVNEQTFDKPSVGPNEGYIYDFRQSDNDTDAQTAAAALTEPGFVWAPEEG